MVMGDLNFPNVNWDNLTSNCNINTTNNNLIIQKRYLEVFSQKRLNPLLNNGSITRRRVVDNTSKYIARISSGSGTNHKY